MMLMISIVAGVGLAGVKNLRLPTRVTSWLRVPLITQNVGRFLCLVLVVIILNISIPDRQGIPFYHMIDKKDYQAFVWIRDNVSEEYNRAILDPWKATAFTAITGKKVHTRIHMAPLSKDIKTYAYISKEETDTDFLKQNDISIMYTRVEIKHGQNIEYGSDNPDLVEVAENIYLLKIPEKNK